MQTQNDDLVVRGSVVPTDNYGGDRRTTLVDDGGDRRTTLVDDGGDRRTTLVLSH